MPVGGKRPVVVQVCLSAVRKIDLFIAILNAVSCIMTYEIEGAWHHLAVQTAGKPECVRTYRLIFYAQTRLNGILLVNGQVHAVYTCRCGPMRIYAVTVLRIGPKQAEKPFFFGDGAYSVAKVMVARLFRIVSIKQISLNACYQ